MFLKRLLRYTHTLNIPGNVLFRSQNKQGRLTLIHTLKLFQFIAKTATCIRVVPHSLRNVHLSHLQIVSVGTRLEYGSTAGNGTSYKKSKGWRRVVTVCSHPHSLRVQFALSLVCRVLFWKPVGSLDYHRNILRSWFCRIRRATRYPRRWTRVILC